MRLHQRNFERVQAAWAAWQLFVLQAQEARRQAMLANAAAAFRDRQLLAAGLLACRRGVADAREARHLASLLLAAFAEWRHQAATSSAPSAAHHLQTR